MTIPKTVCKIRVNKILIMALNLFILTIRYEHFLRVAMDEKLLSGPYGLDIELIIFSTLLMYSSEKVTLSQCFGGEGI